ncbi:hypothetical protein AcV7_008286 [Taiwanofungus camphoratus]|nr:hypothetical protein AcV7_008286 [Antrodia cinnamomea]
MGTRSTKVETLSSNSFTRLWSFSAGIFPGAFVVDILPMYMSQRGTGWKKMVELWIKDPVAPLGIPHRLMQSDFHAGYFLPKGTAVIANIWKFLHDHRKYSDPFIFRP